MRKLLFAASAALVLALPGLSLAQDDHHGHPEGGSPHAPPQAARPAAPQAAPQARGPGQGASGQVPGIQPQGGRSFQGGGQGQRPFQDRQGFQGGDRGFAGGQPNGGTRPQGFGGAQPNGGYRQQGFAGGQPGRGDFRPDGGYRGGPGSYNQGGRAGSQAFGYGGRQYFRYRAQPYRFPGGYYGWANHSWRRGEWLPSPFINSGYFINDWYDFGLWQPDYGYEWIRVGADAVLVNLSDGQVVDVVPGVYYY